MVYELNLVFDTDFLKKHEYLGKMELKLFTTFIVVAAILASPKHKAFTWSYRCRNMICGLLILLIPIPLFSNPLIINDSYL